MKKIISLFIRNHTGDRKVRNEVTPGAEWVINGEGVATRKFDGTCCLVRGGKLFKRHEIKVRFATAANDDSVKFGARDGKAEGYTYIKSPPPGFEACTEVDPITLKQQGWVPVDDEPEDKYHREAWGGLLNRLDGMTAELIGPKVQGNPEGVSLHVLQYHHLADPLPDCPRDYEGLKSYLAARNIEGVVWHHPDGRMVKIKKRDFA